MFLNKLLLFVTFLSTVVLIQGTVYKVTDQVFFDVEQDDKSLGRITIGLFGDIAPKTVKNFKTIATTGINGSTYAGSIFHRVISKFMIQGGDIIDNSGRGSISIYGESFNDENFEVKHTGPGFISMANAGKNTNGCQFFITTIATPWLDGRHTVFGKVVDGQDIVHKIENVKTDVNDRPLKDIVIIKSGIIDTPKPFTVSDDPYDIWEWINASLFPLGMSFTILGIFHWFFNKLNAY